MDDSCWVCGKVITHAIRDFAVPHYTGERVVAKRVVLCARHARVLALHLAEWRRDAVNWEASDE